MIRDILKTSAVLLWIMVLAGCVSHDAPKVTYYSLMTMSQLGETETIASFPEVMLGVGPVVIPDSLKRSQIATRQRGNQYEFDEFNRWAGLLEKDFSMVLGDNLGHLLGIDQIGFFPWLRHFTPTYQVIVELQRLDGDLGGDAALISRWMIIDADGQTLLAGGKSDFRQPVEEVSFAALIKAESRLVADLSKEIAGAIVSLRQ